jgi:hypothetical protein
MNPTKNRGKPRCSERVSSTCCSTSDTRRVNLETNQVINHEWGKDREVLTTNGRYLWSFVTQIFHIHWEQITVKSTYVVCSELILLRTVWGYHRSNLKPQFAEWQTLQWLTEKGQYGKQCYAKHYTENKIMEHRISI